MNCLSESEANVSWLNSKGTWVTYVIIIAFLHLTLLCVLTVPVAWTLTNVINSLVSPLKLYPEFLLSLSPTFCYCSVVNSYFNAGYVFSITLCEGYTFC